LKFPETKHSWRRAKAEAASQFFGNIAPQNVILIKMKKIPTPAQQFSATIPGSLVVSREGGFVNLRVLMGFTLCFVGVALALFAHFSPLTDHVSLPNATNASRPLPYMPAPGGRPQAEVADLGRWSDFWNDRLTYPTGRFDPGMVRVAADQACTLARGRPCRSAAVLNPSSPTGP